MSFSRLLSPAITYAENGFPVTELVSRLWSGGEKILRADANATGLYLPNGRAPRTGEVFKNPLLAHSLRLIAEGGRDAYYKGSIGASIVACSERHGGTMTRDDLAQFSAQWVEPISTTYRGWTVYEIPPNGQGIAALMMLNLMEKFPLAQLGHNGTQALHLMIESKKLAYADMLRYDADPKFSKIPVGGLLAKSYADRRAQSIDPAKAQSHVEAGTPPRPGDDTIYLCVVDKDGMMVSLIQSNYAGFGSGIVADNVGFVIHNRGALFSLDPASPNVLEGHKRPLHTIIPAFMEKEHTKIAFGIMGGWNQSQAHAQFVSNVVDFKMNVQEALEAARFTKSTFDGNDVEMESRIPQSVRDALTAMGHQIKECGPFSGNMGGGQAVMRDFDARVNFGGSDPRKDGAAIPEPLRSK
jgi:gamma-glutamyltranspeptidase/glutathione hydrolase